MRPESEQSPGRRPGSRAAGRAGGVLLLALASLLVASAARAQAGGTAGGESDRLRVAIDRTEISIDEELVLQVTVQEPQDTLPPQLPEVSGLQAAGVGRSTRTSIVNGRASSSLTYTFRLIPTRTGDFTIPPISVVAGDETLRGPAIQVRVLPADAAPGPGQAPEGDELFITASVSDARPYLGEPIVYTWRLYRRVRWGNPQLEAFNFPGFLVEELGDERSARVFTEVRAGQSYQVQELRRILFPQQTGEQVLSGPNLSAEVADRTPRSRRQISPFDDFFGRVDTVKRVLRTPPVTLRVRPLPPAPADFSGLVGSFELSASVSRNTLAAGESTTLKVKVSGRGNALAAPDVSPSEEDTAPGGSLEGFKIYTESPAYLTDRSGATFRSSKEFTRALVPLREGEKTLPGLSLTYFDPEAERFRTATTAPIVLTVTPGAGGEAPAVVTGAPGGKQKVEVRAGALRPPHPAAAILDGPSLALTSPGATAWDRAAWTAAFLLPPVLVLAALLAFRRRLRERGDAGARRRRRARRRAVAALAAAESAGSPPEVRTAGAHASRVLREYVGDRLGIEGSALTPPEAARYLAAAGAGEAVVRRTEAHLARLDGLQYGLGHEGARTASAADVLRETRERIDEIEEELSRAAR